MTRKNICFSHSLLKNMIENMLLTFLFYLLLYCVEFNGLIFKKTFMT